MEKSIKLFKDIKVLSHFFAEQLESGVNNTPEDHFFSLALSGGSTPKAVFQYISLNFAEKIDWSKILVFWGDERCVAPEKEESNYRMARESLLDMIPIPKENIFRIKGEEEPFFESVRYAEVVQRKLVSINRVPQFDLVLLGLGDDGHTASIFPDNLSVFNSSKLFEVAEHPLTKQKRITATGKIINQAHSVVILVTGESKSHIVANVLEEKSGWENFPVSWVLPQNRNLLWLLDSEAGSKLKK